MRIHYVNIRPIGAFVSFSILQVKPCKGLDSYAMGYQAPAVHGFFPHRIGFYNKILDNLLDFCINNAMINARIGNTSKRISSYYHKQLLNRLTCAMISNRCPQPYSFPCKFLEFRNEIWLLSVNIGGDIYWITYVFFSGFNRRISNLGVFPMKDSHKISDYMVCSIFPI